jgi:DNA replication protein DnaC
MADDLKTRLHALGLLAAASNVDDLIAFVTKHRYSPAQILEHLAEIEDKDRARRSLERRMTRSRLGRFKPMADFDWGWPTRLDRDLVESSLRLDFIPAARNVVFVAPQGLGKTMIAQNIAHQAILAGEAVHFITAAQLLLDLGAQESARALDNRLKH